MSNPANRQTLLGLALGFMGVASFSLTLPMTRLAVSAIDAGTIMVWRALIAAIFAVAILVLFYRRWPGRQHLGSLLITGVGIVIGFPVFTTLAMQTIPASHGAIVVGLLPISTAVVSVIMKGERPSWVFWSVSFVGTMAVLIFVFRLGGGGLEIGHLYLLAAVLLAAIGYSVGGHASKELGAPRVICWSLVLMAPIFIPAAAFVAPIPWSAPTNALLALLYLALISQLIGFFAWYAGLAMGGVVRVSQVQLLQIFMTLIASAILLSEPLSIEIWFFAGLVMSCVVVSARLRIGVKGNEPPEIADAMEEDAGD